MDYIKAMQTASNPEFVAYVACMPIPLTKWEHLVWKGGPESRNARLTVLAAMASLPEVSSAVLMARFGEKLTLQEYGVRVDLSRERVRQLQVKAIRQLRNKLLKKLGALQAALVLEPIPGGPCDPDWVTTEKGAELTGLTADHIRYLCRSDKVISKRYDHNHNLIAIERESLKAYVLGQTTHGSRRGIWKGDDANV